jgi:hypothetical protein
LIKAVENGNDVLGIAEIKSAVLKDRRAFVGFLRFVDLRASVLHRSAPILSKEGLSSDALTTQAPKFICLRLTSLPRCLPQMKLEQFVATVLAQPSLGSGTHDPEMDPAIETASVTHVKLWNCHLVASAIEGRLEALAGLGIIWCNKISVRSVEERKKVDHVA